MTDYTMKLVPATELEVGMLIESPYGWRPITRVSVYTWQPDRNTFHPYLAEPLDQVSVYWPSVTWADREDAKTFLADSMALVGVPS